ncbi:hypothetical protein GQ42DRAFT_139931, partial [Ramicandelaber brevisporus]
MQRVTKVLEGLVKTGSRLVDGAVGTSKFVVYKARVAGELAKEVAVRQHLSPPAAAEIEVAKKQFYDVINIKKFPTYSREQLAAGGLVVLECIGFFTVAEMVGRWNVVGYNVEAEHASSH